MTSEVEHVITLIDDEDAWLARLPGVGEVRVRDPRMADYELGELIPGDGYPKLPFDRVRLAGPDGRTVQAFLLLFNPYSGRDMAEVYERVRADPPSGCHWRDDRYNPGLFCVLPGTSRLAAVAEVVAEARARYGVTTELNDLGIEKLWEWFGSSSEFAEGMVSQLLLMAVHRAEISGISAETVLEFVRKTLG